MVYGWFLYKNFVLPKKIQSSFSVFHFEPLGSNHSRPIFMIISQLGYPWTEWDYKVRVQTWERAPVVLIIYLSTVTYFPPEPRPRQTRQPFLTPYNGEQNFFFPCLCFLWLYPFEHLGLSMGINSTAEPSDATHTYLLCTQTHTRWHNLLDNLTTHFQLCFVCLFVFLNSGFFSFLAISDIY